MTEIYIIAEHRQGMIRTESLELAALGRELASACGAKLSALLLGGPARALAEKFAKDSGVDTIGLENENLATYNAEAYVRALTEFLSGQKPTYILISHTATGWDFAPRLAVALKGTCATGITKIFPGNPISFVRQICGGKIFTEMTPAPDTVSILTIMPGAAKPVAPTGVGDVEIRQVKIGALSTRNLGYSEAKRGALDLTKAEVIVSAGRGIGDSDKLELIRRLAECFEKSALGASRPVVDAGWLGLEHQVGQTGQTVRPKLYIACGISGAIQHTAGMSGSELVVAINSDRNANIFNIAHLGIIQELHDFIPILIDKIRVIKNADK